MATDFFTEPGQQVTRLAFIGGAALAVFLFASILLHELAHSLMAIRYKIEVDSITLLPIGGISQFREPTHDAPKEFWITLVGPLTNFLLAAPFLAAAQWVQADAFTNDFLTGAWTLNLVLGSFNLFFPAFPMDGGRLLRAILTRRVGFLKATRVAAGLGRVLAVALGLAGFLLLPGGLWLVLIAFFLYVGATQEERGVAIRELLQDLRVGDLMTREPHILRPEDTVDSAIDTMLRTKHAGFPVIDDHGRILGYFGLDEVTLVPREARAGTFVGEALNMDPVTASPEEKVIDALQRLAAARKEHLLVVQDDHLAGLLSRTDVGRAIMVLAVDRGRPPAPAGPATRTAPQRGTQRALA